MTVLMTDANGLRLFQNFRLVIAAQNPPTYNVTLQDISMTTGEVALYDVTNYNNPDVDGDPVSIVTIYVVSGGSLAFTGTTIVSFTPTTLAEVGVHIMGVSLTDTIIT